MSEFKTRAEISAATEFVQYEELLRSGSLTAGIGVNRALERLAENDNALLGLAATAQTQHMLYAGTISYDSGTTTLSFVTAGAGSLYFSSPATSSKVNVFTTALAVVLPSAQGVVYAVLDRTTDGATVTLQTAADMAAYQALLAAAADRADYFFLAVGDGSTGIVFFDGRRLRSGESLTNGGFTDSQYGQQVELTALHADVQENLNLKIVGGGTLSWDVTTGSFVVSSPLHVDFPSSAGDNFLAAGTYVLATGQSLYMLLSRAPGSSLDRTANTFVIATGSVPIGDDYFVLASHNAADSRLYLADGTAISDGESLLLGGVRQGVQFFVQTPGTGVQALDIQTHVAGAKYNVTSGELMVYRNGVKAQASKAYWEGAYPAGSLNTAAGPILASDDYVEEDSNGIAAPLEGNRILWIRDFLTAPESVVVRDPPQNDPPVLWPAATDTIELFIGTQAQAPTITIPDGIYGFDLVWAQSPTAIRTKGGVLVYNNGQYKNDGTTALEVTLNGTSSPPEVMQGETISAGWNYVYIGPGAVNGASPVMRISGTAPNDAGGGAGTHPSDASFRFLTSVYLTTLSACRTFVKEGSWVRLDTNASEDISAAFPAGVITNAYEVVDISTFLPSTAMAARLLLDWATQAALTVGDAAVVTVRQSGTAGATFSKRSIKAGNTPNVQFEIDVVAPVGTFQMKVDPAAILSIASSEVLGYSEGRFTSGTALGV